MQKQWDCFTPKRRPRDGLGWACFPRKSEQIEAVEVDSSFLIVRFLGFPLPLRMWKVQWRKHQLCYFISKLLLQMKAPLNLWEGRGQALLQGAGHEAIFPHPISRRIPHLTGTSDISPSPVFSCQCTSSPSLIFLAGRLASQTSVWKEAADSLLLQCLMMANSIIRGWLQDWFPLCNLRRGAGNGVYCTPCAIACVLIIPCHNLSSRKARLFQKHFSFLGKFS